jgi:signal transduction histidine kinase
MRAPWHATTAGRLVAAFAGLLVLFLCTAAVCLHAFGEIEEAEAEVERLESARRVTDRAAVLMREQYIHQAHTLIAGDESHMPHYLEIAELARAAVDVVAEQGPSQDKVLTDEMARLVSESDRSFRDTTVPTVLAGDRKRVQELHEGMEAQVVAFAKVAKQLHERNDQRSHLARGRVAAAWSRARWTALVSLAIAALLAALATTAIVRGILRAVHDLRAGAAKLGSGDLTVRVAAGGTGELAQLAHSFNTMASDLAVRQGELVRSQRHLAVTELAAGIAHEINNPLGVILGYVKLMRKTGKQEPESLAIIEEEATRAAEIVQDLLDLTRPQSTKTGDVDLTRLVRDAATRLRHMESLEAVTIREALPDAGLVVRCDEERLRRLVINLIRNAAQAAGRGGEVAITAQRADQEIRLVVEDSGPGVPEELRDRVLDPFFTTKRDGVGLGLSIVQSVLGQLQGSLRFERSQLGGARVVATWPDTPGAIEAPLS